MSSGKYLLVDKTILPPCYEKVVEARALISSGQVKDISEAVKRAGISRSTYYKYKDYVFALNTDTECRKAVITLTLSHKTGMLGEVLKKLSDSGANILTITQNLPINSKAHVVTSIDISLIKCDVGDLITEMNEIPGVSNARLVAIE